MKELIVLHVIFIGSISLILIALSLSPKISKPLQVEQLKNIGSFSTEFENLEGSKIQMF